MLAFWILAFMIAAGSLAAIALPILSARPLGETGRVSRPARFAAVIALAASPIVGAFIYMQVGAPAAFDAASSVSASAPAAPDAQTIASMSEEDRRAMIESMVAGLAARLESEPDDPEGWRMLAKSYRVLGRAEASASAYRELFSRDEGGIEDWSGFAGALIDARDEDDESVSEELRAALERVRAFNPDDPIALYFLGIAARERGERAQALQSWSRLRELLPPDAPVAPALDALIESVSGEGEPR